MKPPIKNILTAYFFVMCKLSLLFFALLVGITPVSALIVGFTAGKFSSGYELETNDADPNYQLTVDASNGTVPRDATVAAPYSAWVQTGLNDASWISINADATTSHDAGNYTYESVNAFTATGSDNSISFDMAVDNSVSVSLTGNPSYTQVHSISTGDTAFNSLHSISFTGIPAGTYKLLFAVVNDSDPGPSEPNPTGLLVIAPIPEPGTYSVWIAAFAIALGCWRRQSRKQ